MKFTKYAIMAAGCALLASCSSDDPIANSNASESSTLSGNDGYLKINLNLPTVSAVSRATEFDAGTPAESDVTNGFIYVFSQPSTATDEADATLVCVSPLTDFNFPAPASGSVSSTSTAIAKLSGVTDKPTDLSYKALVMLNVDPAVATNFTIGTKFSAWRAKQVGSMTYTYNGNTYLTMSNAPLLTAAEPVTLSAVDASKIKASSQEAAKAGPATTVYVQRGVAKVRLNGVASYTPKIDTYKNDNVVITDWMLDIINKNSFLVQRTDSLKTNFQTIWSSTRFFEATAPKRVNWGIDPSYKGISIADAGKYFNRSKESDLVKFAVKGENVLYSLENTFDIDNQMDYETTRVVIKAIYSPAAVAGLDDKTFFKFNEKKELYNVNSVLDVFKGAIVKVLKTVKESQITVKLNDNAKVAGEHSVNDVTIEYTVDSAKKSLTPEQLTAVAKEFGVSSADAKIFSTYASGVSYYYARIKHFGDVLTPWNNGDPTYGENNSVNNEKYLGRYGVVRNNVYDITISSISAPGYPVIPPPENVPDDNSKYYMQVSINILPWAKRSQNVDL